MEDHRSSQTIIKYRISVFKILLYVPALGKLDSVPAQTFKSDTCGPFDVIPACTVLPMISKETCFNLWEKRPALFHYCLALIVVCVNLTNVPHTYNLISRFQLYILQRWLCFLQFQSNETIPQTWVRISQLWLFLVIVTISHKWKLILSQLWLKDVNAVNIAC